jgi:hypothetical protein
MNPLIQFEKICLVCVSVLACCWLSPAVNANTLTVTNTNDSGPGSLRQALALAIHGDTINATRVSGTIFLTSGALQITHNVTIKGPGTGNLAIDGNFFSSVFENFASNVTISGFTITNGGGWGINNGGGLTLNKCSVVRNASVGIRNFSMEPFPGATLTIANCTVSGNSGGGISNTTIDSGAALTVKNCTISGNSGNGISSGASGIVAGGGSTVAISNSTLSGNSGHAISNNAGRHSFASVSVKSCTISGNSGGGIYNVSGFLPFSATLELGSTILKAGRSGENISNNRGTVTSLGYNLATDNGGGFLKGPGDQINTHPLLGPLRDNGGPTFTHALLPGSPAINAGNPNFTPPPSFDQRGPGFARVVDGRIDIGSFEVQNNPTPTPTAP